MIENTMMRFVEITVLSSLVIVVILILKLIFSTKINNMFLCITWLILMIRLMLPVSFVAPSNIFSLEQETEAVYESGVESFDDVKDQQLNQNQRDSAMRELDRMVEEAGVVIDENGEYTLNGKVIKKESLDIDVWKTLFLLWIVVCAVTLIIKLYKIALLHFNINNFSEKSIKIAPELYKLQSYIGIKQKIKVAESIYVDSPIIVGWLEPIIVFPKDIHKKISSKKLDMIIVHELCHIKKMDVLKDYIWLIITSLYWFNPFIHVGYRVYIDDMEDACDLMTISYFNEDIKSEYAKVLLDVVSDSKQDNEFPISASFCEDKNARKRRFEKANKSLMEGV